MPPRKRKAAEAAATPEVGRSSRRRSGRISSSGKRSAYFEGNDNDIGSVDELAGPRPRKAVKVESKSPRRKSKAKAESEDELQHEDEYAYEDEDDEGDGDDDDDGGGDVYEENKDADVEDSGGDDLGGNDSECEAPPVKKRGRGRPPGRKAGTTPVKKKANANAKPRAAAKTKEKAKAKAESKEPDAEEDSDDEDDDEENLITFIPGKYSIVISWSPFKRSAIKQYTYAEYRSD